MARSRPRFTFKKRQSHRPVAAQFRVEQCEARTLMTGLAASAEFLAAAAQEDARAAFEVRVTNPDNSPVDHLDVGDKILISLYAHDLTPDARGFFTAYADVTFDPTVLSVPGSTNGVLNEVGQVFLSGITTQTGPISPLLLTKEATVLAPGVIQISTDPADNIASEVTVFGDGTADLRSESYYGSVRLLAGAPEVTLSSEPVLNDDLQLTTFDIDVTARGLTAQDLADGSLLDGLTGGVTARKASDGTVLTASFLQVVSETQTSDGDTTLRLRFALAEPDGGFGFPQNGTWNVNVAPSVETGLTPVTAGSFDIEFAPPNFVTGMQLVDQNGNPLETVEVGQPFRLKVTGQDLREVDNASVLGFVTAAFHLDYTAALVDVVEIIHHFKYAPTGEIHEDTGIVENAGGLYGATPPGTGDSIDVVEFVLVARETGIASFDITPVAEAFAAFFPNSRDYVDVSASVQAASLTVEIIDPLELTVSKPSLSENGGQAEVTVTRGDYGLDSDLTLDILIGDSSELSAPVTVTIPAGSHTTTFSIDGVDDQLLDGPQSVRVSVASDGRERASATVYVTDHESLTAGVVPVQVGEDAGSFQLTLHRSDLDDLSRDVAITLAVPESFADQVVLPASVIIPAGSSSVTVTIGLNDNDIEDGNREIPITVTADGFLGDTANVVIIDVENPEVVVTYFDALDDIGRLGTDVVFTLENQGTGTARDFTVQLIHSDNAILGDSDDDVRETLTVESLAPGESITLRATVAFNVRTLIERFKSENANTGSIGDQAVSQYVDHVGAIVSSGDAGLDPVVVSARQSIESDEISPLVFDTNSDGAVTPRDALTLIEALGTDAVGELALVDDDGNGVLTPRDVLAVMGRIGLTRNESVIEVVTTTFDTALTSTDDDTSAPAGLVLQYSFDNGAVADLSGQQRETTVHGGQLTADRFGNPDSAYLLNGVDEYITVDNTGLPVGNESRTISAWARIDGGVASNPVLVAYGSNVAGQQSGLRAVTGNWQGSFWTPSYDLNTLKDPPVGEWVHVALVYDAATSTATIYENGRPVGSRQVTPDTVLSASGLTIGRLPDAQSGNSFCFQGAIDDIRVYDTALTAAELEELAADNSSGASQVSLTVPGTASLYQALGGDPRTAPVEAVGLNLMPGGVLQVSASGGTSFSSSRAVDTSPDGTVSLFSRHRDGATRGIADINAPTNGLVLVFTSDTLSADAPVSLDFAKIGIDYSEITPELQQPVFVGNGLTSSGIAHRIVIPAGATHLYFGVVDGYQWENNIGSIDVTVSASMPSIPPDSRVQPDTPIEVESTGEGTSSEGDSSGSTSSGTTSTSTTSGAPSRVAIVSANKSSTNRYLIALPAEDSASIDVGVTSGQSEADSVKAATQSDSSGDGVLAGQIDAAFADLSLQDSLAG